MSHRYYTDEEIRVANKTSRSRGSIGPNAIVPRWVRDNADKDDAILDFGAGKGARHTVRLREDGFNVVAHEFGANVQDIHSPLALLRRYDVVYASNVLNVQSSREMLRTTLSFIAPIVEDDGIFVANYPAAPRKTKDLNGKELLEIVREFFQEIEVISGGSSKPLFVARRPIDL